MPNEITSLLNALNSYITCPVCNITNEIEIILTCGHLICKNCKTKRTKCSVCYRGLTATRPHSPSIKFIKELSKELLKASSGETSCVESELNVGNSKITPNVIIEQTKRNGSGTTDNEKIKKKTNLGLKEDVEISNDHVKIINEINTFRNKDNNRKYSNNKKGIAFYKNYCKHKEDQKVYRKILKGLGIVGIDKQIKKFKYNNALNAREKELNGQLNTIVSRLNDQYPNKDNLENTKFNYSLKMITDNDCSDLDQNIKINYKTSMNFGDTKDGFGVIKCDLKRNGFNLSKTSGGLKRKKVDSGTEDGPCCKTLVKNIDIVGDCIEFGAVNLVNLDKKLGGIVDETEIVQRYLNPSMKDTENEEIKDKVKPYDNLGTTQKSFLQNKSEFPKDGSPITNETITGDKKCERLSKSWIKNIISEFMEEIRPDTEVDGLQSDIMADMLHNVSNEIVVVGNTLCTAEKNTQICNSSINGICDVSSLKNHSVNNSSPCKPDDNKMHSIIIKNQTESYSGDNDIIVVSDTEDYIKAVEKDSVFDSSQTKFDQTNIHLEKDINMTNCKIVLDDFVPLMIHSGGNNIHRGNDECLRKSNVKKFPKDGPPITNETITGDKKCERLSKSEIKNIISEFMEEIRPDSEVDGLQSDIMADMLHNVSNEIVIVGKTLCTAEKNTQIFNSSIIGSCDVSSLKNHSVNNSSPCKPDDNKLHSITIKNQTESNSGDNDIIVVSDTEDDIKGVEKDSVSDSSQTKFDQTNIHLEDMNMTNCKIVLNDFVPLMIHSGGNNIHRGNDECLRKSNVKKCLSIDYTEKIDLKTKGPKEGKNIIDGKKIISGNNDVNLMQTLLKIPFRDKYDEVLNNFEGFTEDDILILTVKLALFKMNGCKYSKNLSSSSLYALDGKQILIKDVSKEESNPDRPCCPNKISKSLVTSSAQTENDLLTVTPSPSTSKIRPLSLVKLHGFEIENEKFIQNDVLDVKKPLTPDTPLGKESIASSLSQNSPVLRTTPVSRRQLSFMSPLENNMQYRDDGASTSDLKAVENVPNSSLNDDWQVLHYRMQHMIPSNPEDALHSEFERSGISPTRLTFTTCGLNSKETALVTKLAQMTKSCLTKDFTHNTTHLVIGAMGRGRLEYYLAIAYRAFIVTMDWVTLCLALNKILPVTGFIPTEDEGPLKCLEPNSLPFAGFHVFSKILPTSSSYPIAEITKTLLSLGGARVLPNLDAFHTLQDGHYPRFFVYNSKSVLTQDVLDKCTNLHILPIQFMWVYESIGAFRAIPVMDFLDIGIHSRTLIRDYKIPDHLACSRYPRLEGEFHPQILDERYQRSL